MDWSLASAVAGRFAPEGPRISSRDAHDAVAEIKEHAQQAQEHVRDVTGLIAHEDPRVVARIQPSAGPEEGLHVHMLKLNAREDLMLSPDPALLCRAELALVVVAN